MDQIEIQDIIFEVSKYRSDILKDVDVAFSQIKKNNKDLAAKKELVEKIKQFTGIKNTVVNFKKDYLNAAVIPIYNQALSADLVNHFKDFEAGNDLKNIDVVKESSKYVKKMYIIFGYELINMFSSRELTAILLHEFGHVYTYTSNLPRILLSLFQKSVGIVGYVMKVPILAFLNLFSVPAYIIAGAIIIMFSRSLTFLEHKGEYRADQFPIKYGYGDEFVKVLYKLHNKHIEAEKQKAWYKKLWDFIIHEIFVPTPHPTSEKRIKEVSEKMLEDYKKLYPNLNKELSIILKDIKT